MVRFVGQQNDGPERAEKRAGVGDRTLGAVVIKYDTIEAICRFGHMTDIGAGGNRVSLRFQGEPQRLAKVGVGGDDKEVAHGRVQIPKARGIRSQSHL